MTKEFIFLDKSASGRLAAQVDDENIDHKNSPSKSKELRDAFQVSYRQWNEKWTSRVVKLWKMSELK